MIRAKTTLYKYHKVFFKQQITTFYTQNLQLKTTSPKVSIHILSSVELIIVNIIKMTIVSEWYDR